MSSSGAVPFAGDLWNRSTDCEVYPHVSLELHFCYVGFDWCLCSFLFLLCVNFSHWPSFVTPFRFGFARPSSTVQWNAGSQTQITRFLSCSCFRSPSMPPTTSSCCTKSNTTLFVFRRASRSPMICSICYRYVFPNFLAAHESTLTRPDPVCFLYASMSRRVYSSANLSGACKYGVELRG